MVWRKTLKSHSPDFLLDFIWITKWKKVIHQYYFNFITINMKIGTNDKLRRLPNKHHERYCRIVSNVKTEIEWIIPIEKEWTVNIVQYVHNEQGTSYHIKCCASVDTFYRLSWKIVVSILTACSMYDYENQNWCIYLLYEIYFLFYSSMFCFLDRCIMHNICLRHKHKLQKDRTKLFKSG